MDVPPPSGTPFRLGRGGGASAPRPPRHSAFHWPWASYPWEKVKLRAKSRQREEDRSCESFGIRAGTADGGVCEVAQSRCAIPSRLLRTAQRLREEAEAPPTRVELGAAETEG